MSSRTGYLMVVTRQGKRLLFLLACRQQLTRLSCHSFTSRLHFS